MSLTITVTRAGGSPGWRFHWETAAGIWVDEVAPLGEMLLRAHAPVGQGRGAGRLRESITPRVERSPGQAMITYYTTVPYARYVLEGTRPHLIEPRNARVLRWLGPGGIGVRYATRVHHPGTRPNPFPHRALFPAQYAISHMFAEAVKKSLEL